ncbi:MAG: hypothetical protein ACRCZM_05890 [Bacteroidales bacterium]
MLNLRPSEEIGLWRLNFDHHQKIEINEDGETKRSWSCHFVPKDGGVRCVGEPSREMFATLLEEAGISLEDIAIICSYE